MNMLAPIKPETPALPEPARIDCTLYELIAALIDEAGPKEDGLAVSAALDLLASGKVAWKSKTLSSQIKQVVRSDSQKNNLILLPENSYEIRA